MPARPLTVLSCRTDRLGTVSPCCAKRGAAAVVEALRAAILAEGLPVTVEESPCLGMCSVGPNLRIVGGAVYNGMSPDGLEPLLDHLRTLSQEDGLQPR